MILSRHISEIAESRIPFMRGVMIMEGAEWYRWMIKWVGHITGLWRGISHHMRWEFFYGAKGKGMRGGKSNSGRTAVKIQKKTGLTGKRVGV